MAEAAPDEEPGRIRGSAIHHFVRWVGDNVGVDVLDRAAATIPKPERGGIRPGEMVLGVLSSKWYRADAVHALLDALVADADAPDMDTLTRAPIEHVMNETLGGVYRALFTWMATPSRYAKYATKLWASYYGDGTIEVVEDGDRGSTTTITDWPGHHPFLCRAHVEAARAIYTHMGCEGIEVSRESCVADGAPCCRFSVRWDS